MIIDINAIATNIAGFVSELKFPMVGSHVVRLLGDSTRLDIRLS